MGTTKKADLMINNGTDYDKILFSTTAEQVEYTSTDGATSNLQTRLNGLLKVVTVTGPSITIGAGAAGVITFTYSAPSGYTETGVIGFYTGATSLVPVRVRANRMDLRNVSTASITTDVVTVTILFARTGTLD